MPTTDNSYAVRTARRRQQAMSAFHRAFPTRPEQGPRGGVTDSSTYLARRLGDMGIRIESAGGAIVDVCCAGGGGGVEPIETGQDVYVTGYYYSSPVTIYNRDGSVFGTLDVLGADSVFIVKYNKAGIAQWATRMVGINLNEGYGISVDMSGNAYVTGFFNSTQMTIYNSDGGIFGTLDSSDSGAGFIVKYNSSGIAQWATRIITTNPENGIVFGVYGVCVDTNGNVHVTGSYSTSPIEIYNSDATLYGTLANSGGYDTFIIKYTTTGSVVWATRIAGVLNEYGTSVSVDINGNVYVTGYYESPDCIVYNQDTSPFTTLINTRSASNVFIVKYSTAGSGVWATRISGTDSFTNEYGYSIAVDISGNVYVAGSYSSTPTIIYNANSTIFESFITPYGDRDAFLVKYNSSGIGVWSTRIAASNNEVAYGVSVDMAGNAYITGYYSSAGATVENADRTVFTTLFSDGSLDIFLVKYNTNGFASWATHIGGNLGDIGLGVSADISGNVYIIGIYRSLPLTIYNKDGTIFGTLTNSGNYDTFVVKYTTAGIARWATRLAGTDLDYGASISVPRFM